jgi:hypothetical protein
MRHRHRARIRVSFFPPSSIINPIEPSQRRGPHSTNECAGTAEPAHSNEQTLADPVSFQHPGRAIRRAPLGLWTMVARRATRRRSRRTRVDLVKPGRAVPR